MTLHNLGEFLLWAHGSIVVFFALWAMIKNKLSAQWQATSLLLIPLVAVLIATIKNLAIIPQAAVYTVVLPPADVVLSPITNNTTSFFNWQFAYGGVMVLFAVILMYKIIRNLVFFKGVKSRGGIRVKESSEAESFSFFNNVHIQTPIDNTKRQIVLAHELWHVRLHHSWQNIALECWQVLFWCNPMFLVMKKALKSIHEFQVDAHMYKTHSTAYMHHLLAHALNTTPQSLGLTSGFVQSLTLKKRLEIMKNPFNNHPWLLLAFPVLLGAAVMVSCEAQKLDEPNVEQEVAAMESAKVEMEPDVMPEFEGGQQGLYQFLGSNMRYPTEAKEAGLEGRVFVQFLITHTGEVEKVKILNKEKDGNKAQLALEKEALRVMSMMPKWKPGEKDGKLVTTQFTLPFMFKLTDE